MYKRITFGSTALITGASSGIGLTFATRFATLGVNLILVARRIDLLSELKSKIESEFKVSVKVFCADLSKPNWKDQIPDIVNFDVDYLVNNAGTGYPGEFGTKEFEEDLKLIQLNCITPLEFTHIFLPKMKKRRKGGIIFVSSTMGMHGIPYMAQYSSTKGYLLNLGESLYLECKPYNVDIEVLMPGATRTPGVLLFDVDYEKLPISWMEPKEVVDTALKQFGRKSIVIPGFRNWFLQGISTCLILRRLIQNILKKYADKTVNKIDSKTALNKSFASGGH